MFASNIASKYFGLTFFIPYSFGTSLKLFFKSSSSKILAACCLSSVMIQRGTFNVCWFYYSIILILSFYLLFFTDYFLLLVLFFFNGVKFYFSLSYFSIRLELVYISASIYAELTIISIGLFVIADSSYVLIYFFVSL